MLRRHFIPTLLVLALVGPWQSNAISQSTGKAAAAPGRKPTYSILVVGDSLSAEYGLPRGSGWVALLQKRLAAEGISADVINASISGDTTSGGRSRIAALLGQHKPTHVVLELGGNDALRGLPLQMTEDNLQQMAMASRKAGARVLVLGMQMPPNYGVEYGTRFAELFARVARSSQSGLVPFLLKGVADGADPTRLFQSDRIHPMAQAHPIMLDNVWPELRKQLK